MDRNIVWYIIGTAAVLLVAGTLLGLYYSTSSHPHPTPGGRLSRGGVSDDCMANCDKEFRACLKSCPPGPSNCYDICNRGDMTCQELCGNTPVPPHGVRGDRGLL
jgi:hypothetical protein